MLYVLGFDFGREISKVRAFTKDFLRDKEPLLEKPLFLLFYLLVFYYLEIV